MVCEALKREKFKDPNWVCTGEGLVTVMHADGLPVVVPEDRLDEVMAEPWGGTYHPEPFEGGDHHHLVIPDRGGRDR
jgi:hypothetical protein